MRSFRLSRRNWAASLVTLLLLAVLIMAEQSGWMDPAGNFARQSQPGLYAVTRFSDGDTLTVDMNGKAEKIRFIGVDTPETHKPNAPVQCYGPAASAYTKNTIGNNKVRLVSDSRSTDRDRYGRLLRYVYLPDGTFMNEKLIAEGYGFYYPYFPFTKSAQFAAAQAKAQASHKGLWGNCSPKPTTGGGYVSNDLP